MKEAYACANLHSAPRLAQTACDFIRTHVGHLLKVETCISLLDLLYKLSRVLGTEVDVHSASADVFNFEHVYLFLVDKRIITKCIVQVN